MVEDHERKSLERKENQEKTPLPWKLFAFNKYDIEKPMSIFKMVADPVISMGSGVVALGVALLVSQLVSDAAFAIKIGLVAAILFGAAGVIFSKYGLMYYRIAFTYLGVLEDKNGHSYENPYPEGSKLQDDPNFKRAYWLFVVGSYSTYLGVLLGLSAVVGAVFWQTSNSSQQDNIETEIGEAP